MPKKTDSNQVSIMKHLRQCGLKVYDIHVVGKGIPDLIVTGYHHALGAVVNLLVEVKTAKGDMSPAEVKWHAEYPEDGPSIVVRSSEEVLKWFGMA